MVFGKVSPDKLHINKKKKNEYEDMLNGIEELDKCKKQ
jgi:hypothetical protein